MSQIRRRRLLRCHKALKQKLTALGLGTYEEAKAFLGREIKEQAKIMGRAYTLTVQADEFDNEIVVGAWLTRRSFPCGEGYSSGYSFTSNSKPRYLSQKKLWAHGY